MSIAVMDVNGWQNVLDLKNGKKGNDNSPVTRLVKQVLGRHPYPGGSSLESNQWITDTALDMLGRYHPDFIFLSYAQQFTANRFTMLEDIVRNEMIDAVFAEALRFVKESGFAPVIIGSGDMIPLDGWIDLTNLSGLAVGPDWSNYAGLQGASSMDLDYLHNLQQVEKIVSSAELGKEFGGLRAEVVRRLPEYLLVAQEGYCFKSPGLQSPVRIAARNETIPVYTELGGITDITAISQGVQTCSEDRKIALIILEGIGIKDFRLPYQQCSNRLNWFCYEPGEAQYLTISCGEHQLFRHSAGYGHTGEASRQAAYPLTAKLAGAPAGTLGERIRGRSIAVGNSSMCLHTVTGADISFGCLHGDVTSQGCLAVIR